ncbi:MAG: hypothetical protein ACREP0_05090 [Rhodanobacteraceae bacterium]
MNARANRGSRVLEGKQHVTAHAARRLGAWAYAALALGLVLYVVAIWLEVFIDTGRLPPSADLFSESHRHWRLRTSLIFLIWSVLGGLTLPFGVGWFVLIPAWLWYLWRTARGLVCFRLGRPMNATLASGARTAPSDHR